MNLLVAVLGYLHARHVQAAAIGGVALAAHGIVRATLDADVLVTDRTVLHPEFWAALATGRAEIREGDLDDPLAGVVRIADGYELLDVVVGKHPWQTQVLTRAVAITVAGHAVMTVGCADLVLLKLFAGGPQDVVDVRLLLAADESTLRSEVESRVQELPADARALWHELTRT
ncbi:MAG: hypothetical protein HY699_13455 [Deltaproteobacteria bacterium]|nr:hypothetical protein [Deltaproteobacteria bacterium]